MSFYLFSTCAVLSAAILMPINLKVSEGTNNSVSTNADCYCRIT